MSPEFRRDIFKISNEADEVQIFVLYIFFQTIMDFMHVILFRHNVK